MAAEMAHELTQPLAAIANYAGACARYVRAGQQHRERLLHGLELIGAQGLRAGEIVRRIRAYVAKRPPQRERADLLGLVRQAVHTAAPEARRQGTPIAVAETSETAPVWVDAVQIEQVIVNLLLNAIESMAAPKDDDQVAVAVRRLDGGQVEVAVRDCGCGVGPHEARMFEPFFTTKPSGLGMGLAISKSIVETHGGRLWATRNAERGTTLHVLLPSVTDSPPGDRSGNGSAHTPSAIAGNGA
jgi:two-component system sensor histidine kinase TtrS